MSAAAISITGGYYVAGNGANHLSPRPSPTEPTTVMDPFASVAGPAAGACDYTNYNVGNGGTFTLQSGHLLRRNRDKWRRNRLPFNAGTYIISGGGVTFSNGATITGSGVMFYLTGTNATYGSVSGRNGVHHRTRCRRQPRVRTWDCFSSRTDRLSPLSVNANFSNGGNYESARQLVFCRQRGVGLLKVEAPGAATMAIIAKQVSFTGGDKHRVRDPDRT